MPDIHPALRADLDRELSNGLDGLMRWAADHDGKDLVEANVDLANQLLAQVTPAGLAAAAAMLALKLHRQGGTS